MLTGPAVCVCGHDAQVHVPHGDDHTGPCTSCPGVCAGFTAALPGQAGAKPEGNPDIDTAAVRALHDGFCECAPHEIHDGACPVDRLADALDAARAEIERLTHDFQAASAGWLKAQRERDEARSVADFTTIAESRRWALACKAEADRLRAARDFERGQVEEKRQELDAACAALARVRELCEETQHGGMPADPEDADADWGAKDLAGKVLAALADAPPAAAPSDLQVPLGVGGPCCDAATKLARVEALCDQRSAGALGGPLLWIREGAVRAALAGPTPADPPCAPDLMEALRQSVVQAKERREARQAAAAPCAICGGAPLSCEAGDGTPCPYDAGTAPDGLPDPPAPADPLTEAKVAEAIAVARANQAFANRLAERIEADRGLLDRLAGPTRPADCVNPPPWSEDDIRAPCDALGDGNVNQDDLIHHLEHHPPADPPYFRGELPAEPAEGHRELTDVEICWTAMTNEAGNPAACILATPCERHGVAVGEGARIGKLPTSPFRRDPVHQVPAHAQSGSEG